MKNRIAALLMAALLVLYLVVVAQHAIILIVTDNPIARVEGVALVVLPIIGAWALVSELVFGMRAQRLLRMMTELGRLPVDELPHLPSGRADRDAADREFPRYQAEVEADPGDWTTWYRLGLAYDASGDRRRARWATRRAIRVERATR
jgi:cytochrome c-type biogenesis protein CcmH/NrfG